MLLPVLLPVRRVGAALVRLMAQLMAEIAGYGVLAVVGVVATVAIVGAVAIVVIHAVVVPVATVIAVVTIVARLRGLRPIPRHFVRENQVIQLFLLPFFYLTNQQYD